MKEKKIAYSVGEMAEYFGVSRDTLRLYDKLGILSPVKNEENGIMVPEAMLGAEDFAFFAKGRPSAFMIVGTGNPEKRPIWPVHHPKFDIDEDGLISGVQMYCNLAMNMK